MAEPKLVNRTKLISSLDNALVEPLNELSKKTRVPKSRLIDEAIEDLLKKYEKRLAE
ncbi:ribbon-helix-helix domain-containing protein [Pseudoflavonifractor sp. AF19-9AC]|uniref:ribbon-helix-helix domain-containing protein n=1 Tax=Pseudoflavonifractor sp. AF19-9AC TaxID=2292244 RepID=UPI000E4F2392|nr:ribbon-helix-helix domain-containing protein [Pseudoflavonifractor sp. AF19-9AC]RHR10804.1 ribbon-helix-helix domain-containing protein [Pseudoflavonifractor sp. AF19-9AC]